MRIVRLTLGCADLGGQEDFWAGTLGLEVTWTGDDELEVRLRSSAIRFRRAALGTEPRYHFAINVPAGSIERAAAWARERCKLLAFHGYEDEEEGATIVHRGRGTPAVYFLDPAGNVVELIANDRLGEVDAGEGFGVEDLLDLAEVGIATAEPDLTCGALCDFLDRRVLWGGAPDWTLTAVGDARSVVIVAPLGRGWIPVGLPARAAPTEIDVLADEAAELTLPEGPYVLRRVAKPG